MSASNPLVAAIGKLLGLEIRRRRRALGLTVNDLATAAGFGPKGFVRLGAIERADRPYAVKMGTLYSLAAALECEPRDLLPDLDAVLAMAYGDK